MEKVKIVLDADVIIHFSKGCFLNVLPKIFSEYDFIVLQTVYNELLGPIRRELDRQIIFLKNISLLHFSPRGEMMKEYAKLIKTLGKGESACMVYCRFNHDVIGSSNLRDIKEYCQRYNLTYLTTVDFLFFAIQRKLMTKDEAVQFISEVRRKDSKLPDVDFDTFVSKVFL